MNSMCRDTAIKKITEMSKEQVSKVLIFMAGMEAEQDIGETGESLEKSLKPPKHPAQR